MVLGPGDVIFIPEGYWHYVRSLFGDFFYMDLPYKKEDCFFNLIQELV